MTIRPLQALRASDWHGHLPRTGAGDFWEWWYFEIDLTYRGDPWTIITVLHFPHAIDPRRVLSRLGYKDFTRYPTDPRSYPGVTSYAVCDRTNEALAITRLAPGASRIRVSRRGNLSVRLGDAAVFERVAPDRYRLRVQHDGLERDPLASEWRKLRFEIDATFTARARGFRPVDSTIIDGGAQTVHWACPLPNPHVELRHLLVRESDGVHISTAGRARVRVRGGYHDHQWGDGALERHIADWSWGRLSIPRDDGEPDDKLIFFAGRNLSQFPRGPLQAPVLAYAPGDGSPSFGLDPIPGHPALRLSLRRRWPARPFAAQNIRYYRRLELAGRMPSGEDQRWRITHRVLNNVDTWPFYLRWLPKAERLGLPRGQSQWVHAISEYARWSRVRLQKVRWVLAESDKVNVREPGAV